MDNVTRLTPRPEADVADSASARTYATFTGEQGDEARDHFIVRDGKEFAGSHLIVDLWGAHHLDDIQRMEETFVTAVEACGATLLHLHLHHFTPNGGVSGVAVLAESHISVHTWPERRYAAFDVFMCGSAEPGRAIPVLQQAFRPQRVEVQEYLRGHWDAGSE